MNWGYFAVAGRDDVLYRTCLPAADLQAARRDLLKALQPTHEAMQPDERFLPDLQERFIAYFEGENVDFSTDPTVSLDSLPPFDRKVLETCRKIAPGETTTYGDLAVRVGHPGAARAVGSALAHNPIPLIIPCHRVVRRDGSLGGFSAPGGLATKQRLLRHERARHAAGLRLTPGVNLDRSEYGRYSNWISLVTNSTLVLPL
jgi:methylated-DNA-[protein]-cysteine S-methyltransferase